MCLQEYTCSQSSNAQTTRPDTSWHQTTWAHTTRSGSITSYCKRQTETGAIVIIAVINIYHLLTMLMSCCRVIIIIICGLLRLTTELV